MKIYINTSNQLISDPKFNSPISDLTFKRGDVEPLHVYFVDSGSYVTPLTARNIQFGLKPQGAYDSTQFIVFAETPTIVGDYYLLNPSFATTQLDALLMVDGLSTNDLASVTLMGEFTWSDDSDTTWETSNLLDVTIANDVIRNTESSPLALQTPEAWLDLQRPAVLALSAYPYEQTYLGINMTLIEGETTDAIEIPGLLTRYGAPVSGRYTYSTTGDNTPPVAEIWYKVYYDTNEWILGEWFDEVQTVYTVSVSSVATDPVEVDWTPFTCTDAFSGVSGEVGQLALWGPDAFICYQIEPCAWTALN